MRIRCETEPFSLYDEPLNSFISEPNKMHVAQWIDSLPDDATVIVPHMSNHLKAFWYEEREDPSLMGCRNDE